MSKIFLLHVKVSLASNKYDRKKYKARIYNLNK